MIPLANSNISITTQNKRKCIKVDIYWVIPRHQIWGHRGGSIMTWTMLSNTVVFGAFFRSQWRGGLMFPTICAWINRWNNVKTGDFRRYCAQYDVIVMSFNFLSRDRQGPTVSIKHIKSREIADIFPWTTPGHMNGMTFISIFTGGWTLFE